MKWMSVSTLPEQVIMMLLPSSSRAKPDNLKQNRIVQQRPSLHELAVATKGRVAPSHHRSVIQKCCKSLGGCLNLLNSP